jgi:hypothetical protein|tara:strand:+ start:747 stop:896 length:150 start_codon:yes stop_codon:yes gene_type:complete
MEIDRQDLTAGLIGFGELTKSDTWSTRLNFIPYVSEIVSFLQSSGKASL